MNPLNPLNPLNPARAPRAFKLGIIGYPLGYSLSPLLHQAAFRAVADEGIEGTYEEYPVAPSDLRRWLEREVSARRLDGFNVTIPHKEPVFQWIKAEGAFAYPHEEWIGAVNTVRVERGRGRACNTDAPGFLEALAQSEVSERLGPRFSLRKGRVVLLGAGGAARAVAFALIWHARVGTLVIWNRRRERAQALAEDLKRLCRKGAGRPCAVCVVDEVGQAAMEGAALLVNAVPVGEELLVDPQLLGPGLAVCDLVYQPPWTALLRAAKRRQAVVVSGLEMLANQAALAFHFWVGPRRDVRGAMRQALRAQVGDAWPS